MHRAGRVTTMKGALALVFLAVLAAAPAAAGDMSPAFGPDDPGSRMKTLQQVWEKITTGTTATADPARPFTGADIDFDGSMHDLNEIFNALPSTSAGGAAESDVCEPLTYWGLKTGAWGGANPSTPYRTGSRDCVGPEFSAAPGNQSINENASATFALEVTDRTTATASLQFLATSSNPTLMPAKDVAFVWNAPTAGKWNVTLTPVAHRSGSSTVTIQALDLQGNRSATQTLTLTVGAVNQQPTVSAIPDQATNHNVPTSVIPFVVSDDHPETGALVVQATSSNTAVVPADDAHLVRGGAGNERTIQVVPAADAPTGTATITITVSDPGGQSRTETFDLTVTHVNRPPTAANVDRTGAGNRLAQSTAYDLVTRPATVSDPDAADTLALHLIAPLPALGTAVVAAGPKITYTTGTSTGSESFEYAVCDNATPAACAVATVSVTVQ